MKWRRNPGIFCKLTRLLPAHFDPLHEEVKYLMFVQRDRLFCVLYLMAADARLADVAAGFTEVSEATIGSEFNARVPIPSDFCASGTCNGLMQQNAHSFAG